MANQYFHELPGNQQDEILTAIAYMLDHSKHVKGLAHKLERFWKKSGVNYPASFLETETYAEHWDDYFGMSFTDVRDVLTQQSENYMTDNRPKEKNFMMLSSVELLALAVEMTTLLRENSDDEKMADDIDEKIKSFFEDRNIVNVPDELTSYDWYDNYMDQLNMPLEISEAWEFEIVILESIEDEEDCPGSQAERDFYNS